MRIITDIHSNEWEIDLNLGNAEPLEHFLKDEYKVNLWSAVETMGLLARPVPCVCVASLLTKAQRDQKGMTAEDFGRGWKGDAAYKLQRVLWDEYKEFFPDPFVGEIIDSTLSKLKESSEREQRLLKTVLTSLTERADKAIDKMEATIGKSFGGSSVSRPSASGRRSSTNISRKSQKRGTAQSGKKSA